MSDYDRILQTALREFEAGVERLVERAFEALPDDAREIPYIGGTYDLHAPPQTLAACKQLVAQALRAQKWYEYEAPKWAQPLVLDGEECSRLMNTHDRRRALRGRYGQIMRAHRWEYENALPFEVFCHQWL